MFEVLCCQVRLAEADGRLWQSDSYFSPNVFMRHWLDLSRPEPPVWEDAAPEEWRAATRTTALLKEIEDSFDHRAVRVFHIGEMACYLHFKYLGVLYDLYRLDEERLLVRVRDPFGSMNPLPLCDEQGEPIPPPRRGKEDVGEDEDEGIDYDHYPPSLYPLDIRRLLFQNFQRGEQEDWWDSEVPLPI